jgi:uncharacterized protein (UPF0333 family)
MLMLIAPVKTYRVTALLTTLILSVVMIVAAASQVGAIARGYTSNDDDLTAGMVAATSESGSSGVERANQNNTERIVGIVTTLEESSVTLASGNSKVFVESEGEISAYVSDIAGKVKRGDLLSLSSFKGILMKATNGEGAVIGTAAEDSGSNNTNDPIHYTYLDSGKSKTTEVVKIKINLNKQLLGSQTADQSPLSKIGESVTGKQLSDIRVLAALTIFVLVMIAEGGIIYGAVTSAITALGRNPMARKIIRREMTRVIIVAIGVLSLGLGAVYGVLWY